MSTATSLAPELTPAVQSLIVAYIRGGGFPTVAAEAAGVPRRRFEWWLRRGRRRNAPPEYRAFALAIMQATAQARLQAEVEVFKAKPLDWLKAGPGKPTDRSPGWTTAARAPVVKVEVSRLEAELQRIITAVQVALAPFPEAAAAVSRALAQRPGATPGSVTERSSGTRTQQRLDPNP
jgi:hypothetical protein